jgi:hypothetical protein
MQYPEVNKRVCMSVLCKEATESIYASLEESEGVSFSFDDQIINSEAYRNVLRRLTIRKPKTKPQEGESMVALASKHLKTLPALPQSGRSAIWGAYGQENPGRIKRSLTNVDLIDRILGMILVVGIFCVGGAIFVSVLES